MALQTSITSNYGIDATYFKIVGFNMNTLLDYVDIILGGFPNQEARNVENPKPIWHKEYHVSKEDYTTYFSITDLTECDPIKCGYKYIKATDEKFTNAIDLL